MPGRRLSAGPLAAIGQVLLGSMPAWYVGVIICTCLVAEGGMPVFVSAAAVRMSRSVAFSSSLPPPGCYRWFATSGLSIAVSGHTAVFRLDL